jgi:O-antigen/teichoic acid export membrane protein
MKPAAEIEIAATERAPWYLRLAGLGGTQVQRHFEMLLERVRRSPLGYRLARGAFWALVSTAGSRALALATSVIAARVLGPQKFGEIGVIQSTVILFGTLAGMGLGLTSTKHVAEFRCNDPAKTGRLIGLCVLAGVCSGLLVAALVALSSPWLATHTLAAPQLSMALCSGSLMIFLLAVNGAQTGALSGFEAFRTIARINVVVGFITCPLVVAGILWDGVQGAVWGNVAASAINVWMSQRALAEEAKKAGIQIQWGSNRQEWSVLVGFSLPALIGSMLAAPVNWGCNAMLVNQPQGYTEMGVLNAANQWYFAVLFIPGALISNAMPVLAERMASGDIAGLRKTLGLSVKFIAVVVVPTIFIGCLASHWVLGMYGASFRGHATTLMVALITAGLVSFQMPVGQVVIAAGRMWLVTGMQLLWALLFCAGTWLSVSSGALGLVSARFVAYIALTGLTVAFAWQQLRTPHSSSSTAR